MFHSVSNWCSYHIERKAKEGNYSDDRLLMARQKEVKPILKVVKTVLAEYKHQVMLKNPVDEAIAYSLNQWEARNPYVDDPTLEIDNNLSE